MIYQFYVFEIQKYANGEYGHIVHFAFMRTGRKHGSRPKRSTMRSLLQLPYPSSRSTAHL